MPQSISESSTRGKRTAQGPGPRPTRIRTGSRTQVACINCKESKLKVQTIKKAKLECDGRVPACTNCGRYQLTCLVEDPATRRRLPRNYLETLEGRVAALENLLQQLRYHASASPTGPTAETLLLQSEPGRDSAGQTASDKAKEDDDQISDLTAKVGMLDLKYSAAAEPHYLGSSSTFAFSRIINSALRQPVSRGPAFTAGSSLVDNLMPLTYPCSLPDYDTGIMLSNAYFENIHPQYPFLHEPTFRLWEMEVREPPQDLEYFDPVPTFFVNMVYAVGSLLLPNLGSLSQQLYMAAQLVSEQILMVDNLISIQAILCYTMFSLRSPMGPSLWKLSGLALRQCIELGYHRSVKRSKEPTPDHLQLELRKRAFWCAWGIDCSVATMLGRPLGLSLQEIDVEFPLDLDDVYVTSAGIGRSPRTSAIEPATGMSIAIQVFRLRCLSARIHTSLYSDTTSTTANLGPSLQNRVAELRQELDDWMAAAPPIKPRAGNALSIFASKDWFEVNYNHSIILLYRSQLAERKDGDFSVADEVFLECMKAAQNICHGYRRQYVGRPINYTWGALHLLVTAGLTYLHCLWSRSCREVSRQDEISSTCTDCTIVLTVMAERWEDAAVYRDIFEALAARTMTMLVRWRSEQWSVVTPTEAMPANNSNLGECLSQEQVNQWMAYINAVGMMDSIGGLLSGFVDDPIDHEQGQDVSAGHVATEWGSCDSNEDEMLSFFPIVQ
ncbi:Uncharacterized protein BP5553_09203 [Venustampulla echinocandica]|uniref:Transcription factor domain-containing protein n=1 Tax=Venustampulla echinocandica TaxID=2656787 RepID=A0A370TC31_9HELO|nr:Uncharacterized protein BP5553_09203 [Venustampulla echinocandica]RDL31801.1 Uncharacterized protein BP5553_09203 [Venustampulla echinocandica]